MKTYSNIPYPNKKMVHYAVEYGKQILNLMDEYKTIGVFPTNFDELSRWILTMFHWEEHKDSMLVVPYFHCGTTS
jgi:hypothetical protein